MAETPRGVKIGDKREGGVVIALKHSNVSGWRIEVRDAGNIVRSYPVSKEETKEAPKRRQSRKRSATPRKRSATPRRRRSAPTGTDLNPVATRKRRPRRRK